MDIPEITAFLSIADSGSFSKAAAQLHISQPAISRRIQSLEQSLQQKLFDRDGQKIHLTAAGQLFCPRAREILSLVKSTAESVKSIGEDIQGPLNISISHHVAEHYLAPILTQYKASYPKVQFFFKFVESEQGCTLVSEGLMDLGFVTIPPTEKSEKLTIVNCIKEELALVAHLHHDLAQSHKNKTAALSNHLALLPPAASFTGIQIQEKLLELHIQPRESIECNAFASLKTLVISGLGWGVLPNKLLTSELVALIPHFQMNRQIGLVHHKNRETSPAAQAFLELSQRIYPQHEL